jgi:hypothetical protein
VEGDILHEAFAVETGAFFEGNCRHADNPLADERAERRAPALASAPVAPAPQPVVAAPRPADSAPRPSAATFAPLKTGG